MRNLAVLLLLILAPFASPADARCPAAELPGAIVVHGTITEEGASGPTARSIDLRSGFWRDVRKNGIQTSLDGYNGTAWGYENGIPTLIDVPPLIPDAAARAFIARLGWNDPHVHPSHVVNTNGTIVRTYDIPGMSRVIVTSGLNRMQPSQVTIDADDGIETTALSQWRCVAGIAYPFAQTQTHTTGETQTIHVSRVDVTKVNPAIFAVPKPKAHGHVANGPPAPFRYVRKGDRHIIVDATIGRATVPLIFDTGAANYFGLKAAKAMGLSVSGGLTLTGLGSSSAAGGFARVPQMTIANGTLNDEVAVVAPLPWPETAGAPVGFAGLEFLAEFRMTIDYPNQTIGFSDFDNAPERGGMRVPFTTEGHFPMIQATVNGVTGWFGVDTGDGGSITLFKNFADRAGIRPDPSLQGTSGGGVGGSVRLFRSHARTFSIGSIRLANARVTLSDATVGAFGSRALAGNLGGGLFHCFRLTFDYRRRDLEFFSAPSTPACLAELSDAPH